MSTDLREKMLKNFISLSIGQYGGMFCNIAFSIWLTRLLSPNEFGLLAIALFYLIFFNWIVEWGWEQGFMAHKEIPLQTAASTHFWIRFTLGSVPILTFLIGYPIIIKTSISQHLPLLFALSGIYWLEKVGLTYRTIIERSYKLDTLAGLEFCTIITSYVTAVIAAKYGFGVYSLVIQRLIEKGFVSIAYFFASPWKIGFDFKFSVVKIFFKSFGIATWLGGIFSLTIYDFMPFLVGMLSSTHEAGIYAKAFSMATFPVMLTGIFGRLTVPLYTHYQFNIQEIRNLFVKTQAIKMILLLPTQLAMALYAQTWIPWLLGTKWLPMIPVYQMMTIYGIARAFFDDVPAIYLYGFKDPWKLTKNQILQSIIIIILGPIFVHYFQALGGAISMGCMLLSAAILFWRNVCITLECGINDFFDFFISLPTIIKSIIITAITKPTK